MLGSVFNGYQRTKGGNSIKTVLRSFSIRGDSVGFSEFRGVGEPPKDLGVEGDVFIDLTDNAYTLYARYAFGWKKWPGPKYTEQLLRHPSYSERILSIKNTIGWFSGYPHAKGDLTVHQLISAALEHEKVVKSRSKKRKSDEPLPEQDLQRRKVTPSEDTPGAQISTRPAAAVVLHTPTSNAINPNTLEPLYAISGGVTDNLRNDLRLMPFPDEQIYLHLRSVASQGSARFQSSMQCDLSTHPVPPEDQPPSCESSTSMREDSLKIRPQINPIDIAPPEPVIQAQTHRIASPKNSARPIATPQHSKPTFDSLISATNKSSALPKINFAQLVKKRPRSTKHKLQPKLTPSERRQSKSTTPNTSVGTLNAESDTEAHPPASQRMSTSSSSPGPKSTQNLSSDPMDQDVCSPEMSKALEIQRLRKENSMLRKLLLIGAVPPANTRLNDTPPADEIGVHEEITSSKSQPLHEDITNDTGLLVGHVVLPSDASVSNIQHPSPCDITPTVLAPEFNSPTCPHSTGVPVEGGALRPLPDATGSLRASSFSESHWQPPQSTFPIPQIEVLPTLDMEDGHESSSIYGSDVDWDFGEKAAAIASDEEDELIEEDNTRTTLGPSGTLRSLQAQPSGLNDEAEGKGKLVEATQGYTTVSAPNEADTSNGSEPDTTRSSFIYNVHQRSDLSLSADAIHPLSPDRVPKCDASFVCEIEAEPTIAPIINDNETGAFNANPRMVSLERQLGEDGDDSDPPVKKEQSEEYPLQDPDRVAFDGPAATPNAASLAGSDGAIGGELSSSFLLDELRLSIIFRHHDTNLFCRLCLGGDNVDRFYQVEAGVPEQVLLEHCLREHYETCEQLATLDNDEVRALDSQPD